MGLSVRELKENVTYDPDTGVFRRAKPTLRIKSGAEVGTINNCGYKVIYINWNQYLAHRLAWFYINGEMPSDQIDHINGNRSDNRFSNLRKATAQENLWNVKKHVDNKSGYKGVHFHKPNGKWRAQGMLRGKRHHLGLFDTPEQAYAAYCDFAHNSFGEYARVA
jgi:hypothetical protein